ncbi:transcriptional regulator [Kocuria sp. cx-455]|uniref:transcriptional regulator n=1 Tax=Kocuria sp. cx-455 TaxID=2771377 RepID=UPI001685A651|nr:transcriptional regulator [Kocuria sp. cx-455]MBD2764954.1 transcriptional regulator [Kocuria sp. cx-455]
MYALTVDRRGSRTAPGALAMSEHRNRFDSDLPRPVLGWQISAGDELQALYDTAQDALTAVLALVDDQDWHVGLGIGAVNMPLPDNVNEATGPAFVAAREAVTASKDIGYPAVRGTAWASHAQAVLTLASAVRQRRTRAAREATDLAEQGLTQQQIASTLGIAQSSVSRRLSSALWSQEQATHPAVLTLLQLADGTAEAS